MKYMYEKSFLFCRRKHVSVGLRVERQHLSIMANLSFVRFILFLALMVFFSGYGRVSHRMYVSREKHNLGKAF